MLLDLTAFFRSLFSRAVNLGEKTGLQPLRESCSYAGRDPSHLTPRFPRLKGPPLEKAQGWGSLSCFASQFQIGSRGQAPH
jgi:hypothetical protein